MDVDEARQNRKAAPVDLDRIGIIGRPRRTDRRDRVPFDRQVEIPAVDMGLRHLVPGDELGGVADDLPTRRWLKRFTHGFASKEILCARSGGRLRFENLVARGKGDPRLLAASPDVPGRAQPRRIVEAAGTDTAGSSSTP